MRNTLIAVLLILGLFPTTARAQTDKHVSIGASIGVRELMDDHFSKKNPSISLLYRLSRNPEQRAQGWVWRVAESVGYATTDFDPDLGGNVTTVGSIRTVPVMGGVERAYRHERLKVGFSLLAGPSFNHFKIDESARPAYEAMVGGPVDGIKVKNSLAARTGVGVWYDLSHRFGLHAGAYYLYGRPKVTTTVDGVDNTETWNIDRISLSTGLAVGLF